MRKTILCLLAILAFIPLAAQKTMTISGVVVDENGQPMPGVFVYDTNNKKTGTMTGEEGKWALITGAATKTLTFEMLSYKTLTLPIKETVLVKLESDANMIDEVVVTGIYTRKVESFTGAAQSVTHEDLKRISSDNVFKSLQTLDPSLLLYDNLSEGSNPNAVASMQIRGASSFADESSSLQNPNTPLFILDGFEADLEKIKDLDMNRIESVTILKDASAKAIYGSKAGNGVIVIETKTLRANKSSISYNGSFEWEMPDLTSYNLCNALEKLEIERREGYYESMASSSDQLEDAMNLYNRRLKRALEGESTYWLSKPLRTAFHHKHTLEVELGGKDVKNLLHLSYNDYPGVMKGSYRKTISGDVSTAYRLGNWNFRNIMEFTSMKSEDSPYGTFDQYTTLNPYYNPYDESGNLVRTFDTVIAGQTRLSVANPLYDASIGTKKADGYTEFTDNLYIEYNFSKALKIVGRFGIESKKSDSDEFYPANHSSFIHYINEESYQLRKGSYTQDNARYFKFSGDVSAQFNKKFADAHDVFATAQYTIMQEKSSNVTNYAEGFPSNRMNDITFARQYAEGRTPSGTSSIARSLGFLLTTGYSYKDRYMLDATVKASASSVFGTNNRWGTFWSVGVAWNLHNEEFFSGASDWLRQLKFRASVGTSGNQKYAATMSVPIYNFISTSYYDSFTGATVQNMGNSNLGWESKMDWNVGVDFKTQRLSLIANVYLSDTKNLVFQRTILPSTGFGYVMDNLGKVRNKGLEISANYRIYQQGSSYFSVFGSIATNDNRILEISDELRDYNEKQQQAAAESGAETPVVQYYNGAPMNSIWVVPSLGIDPVTGKEIFLDKNDNYTNVWSAANLRNYGSSDPMFNGSAGLNGEIKGFGFNLACTFYGGGYAYNTTLVGKVENVSVSQNLDKRIYSGRWYYAGQQAQYRNGEQSRTQATSRFVQKNDVFKISSISLYYEFPYQLIKKAKMQRLRLSVYLNDIYTFSSIRIERGTNYPYARSVTGSVAVTF